MAGFKEFIMRGNVVDLAVGVVIGAAFGNLVKQFTDSFMNPLIKLVTGGIKFGGKIVVVAASGTHEEIAFTYGDFLTSLIAFALTALVVYYVVVLPMNELRKRQKNKVDTAKDEDLTKDQALLVEIRDLLKAQKNAP